MIPYFIPPVLELAAGASIIASFPVLIYGNNFKLGALLLSMGIAVHIVVNWFFDMKCEPVAKPTHIELNKDIDFTGTFDEGFDDDGDEEEGYYITDEEYDRIVNALYKEWERKLKEIIDEERAEDKNNETH